ncbi:MAG: type II secretion system inner membrane protein GspF [Verrucomicrobiales bacterium]|jgi:type IV pilus assembly protein PilC|nr:type II secretion system inner membrane protein GspF [Verrucomicrobiales bacterium]
MFNYTAVDATGQQKTGTIDASNTADATTKIKQQGLFPVTVVEVNAATAALAGKGAKKSGFSFGKPKVKGKVLMVFTRQLATLIDAGMPLLRSLTTLIKQEKNSGLKNAMGALADSVESGSTFSDSLAQHPSIFNKLYVNMVKAGEIGGVLEIVLVRLAEFQEKSQKIRSKVLSAMVYPVVVLVIAIGIMAFLLLFIVPKFEAIFKDMLGNKPLPFLTQMVIDSSRFVQHNIIIITAAIIILFIGYKIFAKTAYGATMIDRIKLKFPLFGDLVSKTSIARFARTLGTLVSSGVPILQALNITKETSGNIVISNSVTNIYDSVKEGESMVGPMEHSGLFPPMVVSMIQVGEETGQLPSMLTKVADVYEEEVDVAVAGLTSLLEPIMIVFLALIVGTIVVALFMPLISIITSLQNATGG